jgi:LysR family hydrogen peroxide-inducible transcriptional activator
MLNEQNVLLLGEGHCFRDQVLEACPNCVGDARLNKKQRITDGSSLETLRYMVLSGLGVTVLPKLALGGANEHPLENNQLVARPINQELASRKIVLAWRRGYPRPQAIEVLKETVLKSLDAILKTKN